MSKGSAKTILAISLGEKRIRFFFVISSDIIALLPTSLPVPEVVGTVIKWGTSLITYFSPPIKSS